MRAVKKIVKLVAAAAVVAAVVEVLRRRPAPPTASPTAPPNQWTPVTPRPAAETAEAAEAEAEAVADEAAPATATTPGDDATTWVEPTPAGGCPDGYPVKAKTSSKIFHVPGGALSERTSPDRCSASAEAAEADGFRASQR